MNWLQIKNEIINERNTTEIIIYGDIGSWWDGLDANTLATAIREADTDYIDIRMLTGGGSLVTALAVYNVLKSSGKEIRIHNDGIIASAGTVIACAGTVYMPNNALYMVHSALISTQGNAKELRETAEMLDKFDDGLKSVYKIKSGMNDTKIDELMSKDSYLTATEAKELGLIDHITDDIAVAASAAKTGIIFNSIPLSNLSAKTVPQFISNNVKSTNTTNKGGETMDLIKLKSEHADVYAQAKQDGLTEVQATVADALKAERQRIAEIQDMALAGQDDLVKAAIDGGQSAGEFAMAAMRADKAKRSTHIANRDEETKVLANIPHEAPVDAEEAKILAQEKAFMGVK